MSELPGSFSFDIFILIPQSPSHCAIAYWMCHRMIKLGHMRFCYWHNLHSCTGEIKPLLNEPGLNSQPFSLFFIGTKDRDLSRDKGGLSTARPHCKMLCELHQGCILKSDPHVLCGFVTYSPSHSKQCFLMPDAPSMSLGVFWRSEERHTTVGLDEIT